MGEGNDGNNEIKRIKSKLDGDSGGSFHILFFFCAVPNRFGNVAQFSRTARRGET